MKVPGFILALTIAVNSLLISQEEIFEDGWLGLGANFGNYFQSDKHLGDFYLGSPGINFSGYGFSDHRKKIGFFYNYALLFPGTNTLENNFDPIIQADFLLGPVFRHRLTEKATMYYGLGFDFQLASFLARESTSIKSTDFRLGLGIGGDVGLKYDITDVFYLNIGTVLTYNFASYRITESTTDNWRNTSHDSSGWASKFSMFGIRPYIAFGVNFYGKKNPLRWGKPESAN